MVNKTHLENNYDNYFGTLADCFEKDGLKTHTILINHCYANSKDLVKSRKGQDTTVLPSFSSPLGEVIILAKLLAKSFSLPQIGRKDKQKFFILRAKLAQFSARALCDFRIGFFLNKLISSFRPKIILHTFEGNGWEKIITLNTRNELPNTKVIAYQHAVLFPGDRAININYANKLSPHHVFCVGDYTKNILRKESEHKSIHVLGSPKINNVQRENKPVFQTKKACLFAPEGNLREIEIMLKVAGGISRAMPKQMFIFRMHPLITERQRLRLTKSSFYDIENLTFSNATLQEDLNNCSWICYRGSTVAFEGLSRGLRPIYIEKRPNP